MVLVDLLRQEDNPGIKDSTNLSAAHPAICFDPADEDSSRRARKAFDEIMALGLDLDGTITGEHGVGVLKREWLRRELGPVALKLHRGINSVLDPLNLLNPGKLF